MLAGLSIDGGLSWNGWTRRGLSDQGDLYGSGGVTNAELYEVYTTTFAFDASTNTINDSAVRAVAPAPDGFAAGRIAPTPAGPFAVSKGAFADGNTILGIGVRVQGAGSIVGFKPTLRFDLDNDSYASASKAGRPVGRTSFTSFSEQGDFTVQFEGGSSWRGSTISVQAGPRSNEGTPDKTTYTGTNDTVLLPGGVGSGTSYDFAFRAFAQPAANAYQMFIDMTAIPKLYGSVDPASVYKLFFPNKAGVGTIGDRVTVSLNGLGSNNVVFDANLTLPSVYLDVTPGVVDEDGSQGLVYTFARSVALPTPLTISYDVVGGTATEGIDYTGLPPATGGRSITIPANALTASVTVFPIRDSEIEHDETVGLALLWGAGYGLGARTVATGTILNDDYLLNLALDGLPEETAPEPNELSPGAFLPIGGGRTRLDLIVESPGYAGSVTLFVTTGADGADAVTLWDAEEDGTQVLPTTWQVGQHPRTLWVETTGVEADIQFIAMFQNKGTTKQDAAQAKPRTAAWSTADVTADGNPDGKNQITPTFQSLTYEVDVELDTGDPAGNPPPGGPDDNALRGTAERLNKWMHAFAKQAGLGTDDEGRQFVGVFDPDPNKQKLPKVASQFIQPSVKRMQDGVFTDIGPAMRGGQMRNNIWRIELVPIVTPWEWNAAITLPKWKQFTTDADRLNPDVKKEWENFIDALAGHEKIHKEKWEQYVRVYQSRVDDFAKTRFFGEAADPNEPLAKVTAWNNLVAKFKAELRKLQADLNALTDQYQNDQKLYDTISGHGRTQKAYDPAAGKNIQAVADGLRLMR